MLTSEVIVEEDQSLFDVLKLSDPGLVQSLMQIKNNTKMSRTLPKLLTSTSVPTYHSNLFILTGKSVLLLLLAFEGDWLAPLDKQFGVLFKFKFGVGVVMVLGAV